MNKIILKNSKDLKNYLVTQAESSLFAELCMFVGIDKNGDFICEKMQNRSKDPFSYFMIDPYDYLNFILENKMLFIFHTHLVGDENASDFDLNTSENCCFPFVIYSVVTEKFSIYEPKHKDYDVNIIQGIREILI